MKNFILLSLFILFLNSVQAGIEYRSFYFDPSSHILLPESENDLNDFIAFMKEREFQLIEMNGFCVSAENPDDNSKIAEKYIDVIKNRVDEEYRQQMTVNNYAGNMIKMTFTPKSWDRVDVYFYIGRELVIKPDMSIVETIEPDTNSSDITNFRQTPRNEMAMNEPIVMPIQFVGGKTKIKKDSYDYLENLYTTLVNNPELFAHIRGHVCCGNKWLQSRKRAHVVYKYLVKKGIDKHRLSFKGYSNNVPLIYPEISDSDKAANRRVDIIFTTYKGRRYYL